MKYSVIDKKGKDIAKKYSTLGFEERRLLRLRYIQLQNGKCFYCKEDLTLEPPKSVTEKPINWSLFPSSFLKYPIHLQHSHDTDMTEGAVHAYCNAVMWQYEHK